MAKLNKIQAVINNTPHSPSKTANSPSWREKSEQDRSKTKMLEICPVGWPRFCLISHQSWRKCFAEVPRNFFFSISWTFEGKTKTTKTTKKTQKTQEQLLFSVVYTIDIADLSYKSLLYECPCSWAAACSLSSLPFAADIAPIQKSMSGHQPSCTVTTLPDGFQGAE